MRKRLMFAKVLTGGVVATAFVSHHAYSEESVADLVLEISGFTLLGIAALGRIWSAAYISGKKSKELVTDGPYSIMRNPLYFFSFLGFVGAGLAFESLYLAGALAAVFFLTHWPTILKEERKLAGIFGESFAEYKEQVPRFIPAPWRHSHADSFAVSPPVFSKAIMESWMIFAVFLCAHTIEWAHTHQFLPVVFRVY